MLAEQVGAMEKPLPICWTLQLPSQPLTRTRATVLHLGQLVLTLTFVLTVLHDQNDLNLNLPPDPMQGAGARSSQDSGCWANAKSGAWSKNRELYLRRGSRKGPGRQV